MRNTIIFVSLLFILSACGGGGGGGGGSSSSPSQVAGVWDFSMQVGGVTDEYYVVIRADGTGADYDYAGDSFDNFADCYWIHDYTFEHQGGNTYLFDDGFTSFEVSVTVKNDTMTLTFPDSSTLTVTRLDRQESEFTPDCDGGGVGEVPTTPTPNPTLDIPPEYVGVWDSSSLINGVTDEVYTVFRADGSGADYDYAGDTFDNFGDCYWIHPYTLTYQGGDSFVIELADSSSVEFSATVANDVMTITLPDSSTFNFPRSDRQESEFTPECQ